MAHVLLYVALAFAGRNGLRSGASGLSAENEDSAHGFRLLLQDRETQIANSTGLGSRGRSGTKKRLHVLSMGRGGSCYLGGVMSMGRPYIFEPFNAGRAMWNTPMGTIKTPLHCLYDCTECGNVLGGPTSATAASSNQKSLSEFCESQSTTTDKVMVIKTVNLDDYGALLSLSNEELAETMFVHLVRDPRAIVNGNRCMREYLQALSAKDFLIRAKIPSDQFVTLFFENWAQNVEGTVKDLHGKLGWPESPEIIEKAVSDHKSSIDKWAKSETNFKREEGLYCNEMMSFFGYKKGSSDYSALTDSRLHEGALTETEANHLANLRTLCKPCCDCPPSIALHVKSYSHGASSSNANDSIQHDMDGTYGTFLFKAAEGDLSETDFNFADLEDDQDFEGQTNLS